MGIRVLCTMPGAPCGGEGCSWGPTARPTHARCLPAGHQGALTATGLLTDARDETRFLYPRDFNAHHLTGLHCP